MLAPRSTRTDLLILLALCAVAYFIGLTTHGLTNWQEAQRALVARDMWARAEWIVPTVHGEPYLAKPPVIYWCQLALARLTGTTPGEWHLRFTVALAGAAGVIATYLVARRLLAPEDSALAASPRHAHWHEHAAFWAAAFLATGILAARSGRIGELDILLIPPTVIAAGAVDAAWRAQRAGRPTRWGAVILACACAAFAALVKGPPALLTIAIAAYGGIALWHASLPSTPARDRLARVAALLALVAGGALLARRVGSASEAVGLVLIAAALAYLAWLVARLADPARFAGLFRSLWRTHPVAVLLTGAVALWLWSKAVALRIGPEAVASAVRTEADDNLRLLVLDSPLNNLEAAAYGVGLGSIAAVIALVWLIKDKPRLSPGMTTVVAWCLLGLIAFSLLGKGVPRYLTPIWPGIALLGGAWAASAIRDLPRGRGLARVFAAVVALLAVGQGLWYGYGREALNPERSPRAFSRDLLTAAGATRVVALDVWHPAIDFYLGAEVPAFAALDPGGHPLGARPPLRKLVEIVKESGEAWTIICPAPAGAEAVPSALLERLNAMGLRAEPLRLAHTLIVGNGRTEVVAARVTWMGTAR